MASFQSYNGILHHQDLVTETLPRQFPSGRIQNGKIDVGPEVFVDAEQNDNVDIRVVIECIEGFGIFREEIMRESFAL